MLKNMRLKEDDINELALFIEDGNMPALEHLALEWKPTTEEQGALSLVMLLLSLGTHGGALKRFDLRRMETLGVKEVVALLGFLESESFLPELKVDIYLASFTIRSLHGAIRNRLREALRKRGQRHPFYQTWY